MSPSSLIGNCFVARAESGDDSIYNMSRPTTNKKNPFLICEEEKNNKKKKLFFLLLSQEQFFFFNQIIFTWRFSQVEN